MISHTRRGYEVPELKPGEVAEEVKLVRHDLARAYLAAGWDVKCLRGHHAHYSCLAVRKIAG